MADQNLETGSIDGWLGRALAAREHLLAGSHDSALRLFNGFLEGCPELVIDLYATTLVLYNYAEDPAAGEPLIAAALDWLLARLPFIQAAVVKTRGAADEQIRRGRLVYGAAPARKIRENGVWYAVDLMLNLDASLYLDTRNLRGWITRTLREKRVLNTFAYTGSLGVAALAGGACQVIQMDMNRRFLNLAKDSCALNGLPVRREDYLTGDFWVQVNHLKRAGTLFDCVIVDPPFFSSTARGKVDLVGESQKVLNKVRPLVGHNGWLVAINNALFLNGAEYQHMLQDLCADGYLVIEALIPVPEDVTGYRETISGAPPADPAPFNHSTKIAILRVRRKDEKAAACAEATAASRPD